MSDATGLTYTCVNDLVQKAKINFVEKEPRSVYQWLPAMRHLSDEAKHRGNDEAAYIHLKRWLDSVEWLMRTRVKDGKSNSYARSMTLDQIKKVKNELADMGQKLDVRYELNFKKQNKNTVEKMEVETIELEAPSTIEDKRPSWSDSANGQRLKSPESPLLTSQPKMSNKVLQNEVSVKPVIDRSSKPTVLKTYDPRCKEILRFMKELIELAKSKKKLANELMSHEYQLYAQREDKYSASDEKYLRAEIKSLKVKLEYMHEMYLEIVNEFKPYLKEADTIKFNVTDYNEKKNLELNLFLLKNQIKDIETKRKNIQETLVSNC